MKASWLGKFDNLWWIGEFYRDFKFELWMLDIPNKNVCIKIFQNPNHEKYKLIRNIIMNDPHYAYLYALFVLETRFPDGEKAIASDPKWARLYATYVLHDRFPLGEPTIKNDPLQKNTYEIWFNVIL